MKALKRTVTAALGLISGLYIFGADGVMDAYGVIGFLAIGGCLLAAWILSGLAQSARYTGRD